MRLSVRLAVRLSGWWVLACCLALPALAQELKTKNVVLIVLDGLRWQEVFTGADPLLISNEKAGGSWTALPKLKSQFWSDEVHARRRILMPFLWETVATHGQLFGNRRLGSQAVVTNPFWISYPGYNEITTGVADRRIRTNEFGVNPNTTVFEWLNDLPDYHDQVEIVGNWASFHDIFNEPRSHLLIRSGETLLDPSATLPAARQLRELYETTTRLEDEDPMDSFVHLVLRDRLMEHHPRVLFVGYGDIDNWAHLGRYDALLQTVQHADAFIKDLWEQMQAIPQYRDQTTFIITTDHGRGSGPLLWREHGVKEPGSENIWIAVMGPDTPALGERTHIAPVTQGQIAATVAAVLGRDFRRFKPKAAPPLPIFKAP